MIDISVAACYLAEFPGGYYFADSKLCEKIMRPSDTFIGTLKAADQA